MNEDLKDTMKDINRPERYTDAQTGRDLIDLCPELGIDFAHAAKFNIFKYLRIAGKKEGTTALKDYLKAEIYLKRLIEMERKKTETETKTEW